MTDESHSPNTIYKYHTCEVYSVIHIDNREYLARYFFDAKRISSLVYQEFMAPVETVLMVAHMTLACSSTRQNGMLHISLYISTRSADLPIILPGFMSIHMDKTQIHRSGHTPADIGHVDYNLLWFILLLRFAVFRLRVHLKISFEILSLYSA